MEAKVAKEQATKKWPGWLGQNVFKLMVPVIKVGSIIGRKGELVRKLCDDTHACVRILEGPLGTPDRIVKEWKHILYPPSTT